MLGSITKKQESKVEDRKRGGNQPPFFFSRRTLLAFFFHRSACLRRCTQLESFSLPRTTYICIYVCICTYLDATVCFFVFYILVCNHVCVCLSFFTSAIDGSACVIFFFQSFSVCVYFSLYAHHLARHTGTQRQTRTPGIQPIDVPRTKGGAREHACRLACRQQKPAHVLHLLLPPPSLYIE